MSWHEICINFIKRIDYASSRVQKTVLFKSVLQFFVTMFVTSLKRMLCIEGCCMHLPAYLLTVLY